MKRSITDAIEQVLYALWNLNEAWEAESNIEGYCPESNPFGQDLGTLIERVHDWQIEVDNAIDLPLVVVEKDRRTFWSNSERFYLGELNCPEDFRWVLYKSTSFMFEPITFTKEDFKSVEERTAWAINAIRKYKADKSK